MYKKCMIKKNKEEVLKIIYYCIKLITKKSYSYSNRNSTIIFTLKKFNIFSLFYFINIISL